MIRVLSGIYPLMHFGGAVNACRHCAPWQSLPTHGVPVGSATSLPGSRWWKLSRVRSLTILLGWTTFCSTSPGLVADLWDHCQSFLFSCSLNTAFPKLQLLMLLWVSSLALQRWMLIETSRQTAQSCKTPLLPT